MSDLDILIIVSSGIFLLIVICALLGERFKTEIETENQSEIADNRDDKKKEACSNLCKNIFDIINKIKILDYKCDCYNLYAVAYVYINGKNYTIVTPHINILMRATKNQGCLSDSEKHLIFDELITKGVYNWFNQHPTYIIDYEYYNLAKLKEASEFIFFPYAAKFSLNNH